MKDFYIASYSRSQGAYHLETAIECVQYGLSVWSSGGMTDYVPVGFFKNHADASEYIKTLVESSGHLETLRANGKKHFIG